MNLVTLKTRAIHKLFINQQIYVTSGAGSIQMVEFFPSVEFFSYLIDVLNQ